ncbi:isoprenoid biosynthesis glyoxalase ElbB [Dasania sp. GY-MA-18]|uniref:Glyoxalase n=1 Tax=Dasania phycosphaerae TaxID=2950436 RepID=A0A9J6RIW9_9GAMM|nr:MULTISPECIES: isoprenoid biosynthesis glyoxalase ElbB [Dasania]MCR8922210.1 isoprenoid biosynthesis glyoxalase ElbB [Dasania sp. GY-MA-18]MCZ0864638.1 isoprenoid biosynthesis glyoxalase ElbB [Dasania phycosphaerae]MCZ0868366.1 isoprenoid biosynthesis glyoxalase ElbB [Dasania phycosphaerae]
MKKVAVVLAGCGVYDGSEINEAVLTLLSLEQEGASYQCYAPDVEQMHVVNHLTGEVSEGESRNVLVEAARIARGEIKPLSTANAADYDALVVPGGFGAAKNLSDFAVKGAALTVQADLLKLAQAMRAANKPVGLICIAPTMSAAIFGEGVKCTIGHDAEVAAAITSMGAEHVDCGVEHSIVDSKNKLVTTPAYMLAGSVLEAYKGIHSCVKNVLAMA